MVGLVVVGVVLVGWVVVRGMDGNPQALHRPSCSSASRVRGASSFAPDDVTAGVVEPVGVVAEEDDGLDFCLCLSLLLSSADVDVDDVDVDDDDDDDDEDDDDDDDDAIDVLEGAAIPPYLTYTPSPSLPGLKGTPPWHAAIDPDPDPGPGPVRVVADAAVTPCNNRLRRSSCKCSKRKACVDGCLEE